MIDGPRLAMSEKGLAVATVTLGLGPRGRRGGVGRE